MSDNVEALTSLLRRIVQGRTATEEEVEAISLSCTDPAVQRAANEAWLELRRFVDDADIRLRDQEYERALRKGLSLRLDELDALKRGIDPLRRRASWIHRMLWQMGVVR